MKIGILGGSFNPSHKGHVDIVCHMNKTLQLSLVLFMVAKCSPFKVSKTNISFKDRYNLLSLLLDYYKKNGINYLKPSDFELSFQQDVVYTVEVLKKFKEEYPNDEIYFIMGQDSFDNIHKYKDHEWLLNKENICIIVYGRVGYDNTINKENYDNVIFMDNLPINDISSTEIREILEKEDYNNKRLNDCLIEEQIKYIKKNGLYTNN